MALRRLTSLALVLLAFTGRAAGAAAATAADPVLGIGPATRLLVVSPHPDDETLCCAGVIQRVLRAGGQVSIVWITSGDGSAMGMLLVQKSLFDAHKMRAYGALRMREARTATALLGVPPQGQLFLGYPDGGMLALLGPNRERAYTSRFTAAAAVPYPDAVFPAHPYTGASFEQDLRAVVDRVSPTLILAPSPVDGHDDHRAVGLAALGLSATAGAPPVRYWVVHGGDGWPSPRGLLLGVPLTPAPRAAALPLVAFALDPPEEDRKLSAVRSYQTQMKVMEPFLLSFVRTTELFSSRATADTPP